jgi:hypothetical protein
LKGQHLWNYNPVIGYFVNALRVSGVPRTNPHIADKSAAQDSMPDNLLESLPTTLREDGLDLSNERRENNIKHIGPCLRRPHSFPLAALQDFEQKTPARGACVDLCQKS